MSKTISSANLSTLDAMINTLSKNVCLSRVAFDAFCENTQSSELEELLSDSMDMLEKSIKDLRAFDCCIRKETDYL